MGDGINNRDRRLLRSKKRGQENQSKISWCEYAPVECTCLGTNCKEKGGR